MSVAKLPGARGVCCLLSALSWLFAGWPTHRALVERFLRRRVFLHGQRDHSQAVVDQGRPTLRRHCRCQVLWLCVRMSATGRINRTPPLCTRVHHGHGVGRKGERCGKRALASPLLTTCCAHATFEAKHRHHLIPRVQYRGQPYAAKTAHDLPNEHCCRCVRLVILLPMNCCLVYEASNAGGLPSQPCPSSWSAPRVRQSPDHSSSVPLKVDTQLRGGADQCSLVDIVFSYPPQGGRLPTSYTRVVASIAPWQGRQRFPNYANEPKYLNTLLLRRLVVVVVHPLSLAHDRSSPSKVCQKGRVVSYAILAAFQEER